MSAKIIDGKKISEEIKNEIKAEVAELAAKTGKTPCLAVVLVGADAASLIYVGSKKKACEELGLRSVSHELPAETTEEELLSLIDRLNDDASVNGILVQMPVPAHIDESKILLRVSPVKDVDGFHPYNAGLLSIGKSVLKPGTAWGIIELLKRSGIEIAGKNCAVVGRSNIVGKPTALLLLAENGTVTVCHSKTQNLAEITKSADILVSVVGKKHFITQDMVKEGAAVVDVGIHRVEGSKKIYGDVADVSEKAGWVTPVPGGVGPMTIVCLLVNTLRAACMQAKLPPPAV